jgi:hypothetical protein
MVHVMHVTNLISTHAGGDATTTPTLPACSSSSCHIPIPFHIGKPPYPSPGHLCTSVMTIACRMM